MSKLYLANDHGGLEVKEQLKSYLAELVPDDSIEDLGCHNIESTDYPGYAHELARKVSASDNDRGILICGSGIGMSIAANRIAKARAALCWDVTSARLSRQHNNANVLCLGARLVGIEVLKEICQVWLNTDFEGGRHNRRVDAIETGAPNA